MGVGAFKNTKLTASDSLAATLCPFGHRLLLVLWTESLISSSRFGAMPSTEVEGLGICDNLLSV